MAFASSKADIVIYGGAAGGGKSWALTYSPLPYVHIPGFLGVIFRRESPELKPLLKIARELYPLRGGVIRESPNIDVRFPPMKGRGRGGEIIFRHLQHAKDVHAHQGPEYAFIGFDELCSFEADQFWYLVSRLRTTCGVTPFLRATCNPDPDSFVKGLIRWWLDKDGRYPRPERSGVPRYFVRDQDTDKLRWADTEEELLDAGYREVMIKSLTFIASSLQDNRILMEAQPGYEGTLLSLNRVDRERLLRGNWQIREDAGSLFKRAWFPVVVEPPSEPIVTIRHWDKAATEAPADKHPGPDWTRGARVSLLTDGRLFIHHVEGCRLTPGAVNDRLLSIAAQDGKGTIVGLWQDPGQAGKADVEHTQKLIRKAGFASEVVRASQNKLAYAKIWSSKAERGDILLQRGAWNEAFLGEAESFPEGAHDDIIDAVSGAVQLLENPEIKAYAATLALHRKRKKARKR